MEAKGQLRLESEKKERKMITKCNFFRIVIVLVATLVLSTSAFAMVTNERLYYLGENDVPTCIAFAPGNPQTVDSVLGVNADKIGLTFYHPLGLVLGSTCAMEFTNIDSRYVAPAALAVPPVTENFGMEAYIQVGLGVTEARAFYNGGDGAPFGTLTSGYGLGVHSGQYSAFVAGLPFPTFVPVVPGVPVEMAMVNTGITAAGAQFIVYVQQIPVLQFVVPAAMVVPPAVGEVLSMGNFVGNQSTPAFAGVLDEARIFTFAPGDFNPSTDLGAATGDGFAGTPGQANCHGKIVSVLAKQFRGINAAAVVLGFPSVYALQESIREFCEPAEE